MGSPAYRLVCAAAAFVAASLIGGRVPDPSEAWCIGVVHAQPDAASRTLRLAGSDVVRARHSHDPQYGTFVIEVRFSPEAGAKVSEFTTAHLSRKVDLRVNGRLIMSPVIRSPIGASMVITGSFTEEEARATAAALGKGSSLIEFTVAD